MIKVLFKSHNKETYCKEGDLLLDVARAADIFIDAPCNGNVSCGKCKVKILNGNVDTEKTRHITDDEIKQGYVLACNSRVISDIEVEVPPKLSSSMHGMKIEGGGKEKDEAIFNRAKDIASNHNLEFRTNIKKKYVELDEPTLDDNISDVDRLQRYVRNNLGYNEIDFRLDILRKIPKVLRENDFKVTLTYVQKKNKLTIINIDAGNTGESLYGVAIDIGTTSVVVCLVDLENQVLIDKASSGNAQIKYGADVINRIVFSTKKDGLDILYKAIIHETINPLLRSIYEKNKKK